MLIADTTKDGRRALEEFFEGRGNPFIDNETSPFRHDEGDEEYDIGNHVLGEDF